MEYGQTFTKVALPETGRLGDNKYFTLEKKDFAVRSIFAENEKLKEFSLSLCGEDKGFNY